MRDIRRYWKEVRALEASLPEFVWLVDVEGSVPVEVGAGRAAQLLLAKSHRVASEDELSVQREKELGGAQGAAEGCAAAGGSDGGRASLTER